MFPNLGYLYEQLFHHHAPGFLYVVQSFGFMMALSFVAAAYVLSKELKRKEKQGLLKPVSKEVLAGTPASVSDLVWNGILGFALGFKIAGIIVNSEVFADDPQSYIFSSQGNLFGGIALAAGMVYWKYREKEKHRLPQPEKKTISVFPHQMVGDITIVAAIAGILGSKILDSLEHFNELIKHPIETLLSFSGLAFYGGLILGCAAVTWFCLRNKIPPLVMADAIAPTVILAYGIGRIGCQVAGDGDWGILNSAYVTEANGKVVRASEDQFQQTLQNNQAYYTYTFEEFKSVPHKSFAPSWLPVWLVAQSYPNNVNEDGVTIKGCEGKYCSVLPVPVFPTPVYEIIVALLIFVFLMMMRKRIKTTGIMVSLYLLLNGIERFFVEIIRVNKPYFILGITLSQAQIIAIIIVILGIGGMIYFPRRKPKSIGNPEV